MIESGRLRHQVRLEKYDYVRDSAGQVIQDKDTGETPRVWVPVATVWAAIEPLSGREFIQSQAIQSAVTARIVIRFRDDVTASMRAVHVRLNSPDVIYNIQGVLADKETGVTYLTLPVSTGVGEGQ